MPIEAVPAAQIREPCCGLPIAQPNLEPVPVNCAGQNILSADVPAVRGKPLLTRMRAVQVPGGVAATVRWQMHDPNGIPVDLRSCLCASSSSASMSSVSVADCSYRAVLYVREYLDLGSCAPGAVEIDATTTEGDAADGYLQAELPKSLFKSPGVYFAEMAIVGTNLDGDFILFSNVFFLYVGRGSLSNIRNGQGPPSIAELRMFLRDSSGSENYLLDRLKFDDAEIAAATVACVEEWNETPPNINRFTTRSFPFRRHWMEGIIGRLFLMAAEQFRANNLKYAAAGVTVDDQDKELPYEQAGERRLKVWRDFVRAKKHELNLARGWGASRSVYSRYRVR